jgi:hypothetical protein
VGPPRDDGWNPTESAPLDEDVSLQVTDGRGKPYTIVSGQCPGFATLPAMPRCRKSSSSVKPDRDAGWSFRAFMQWRN